MAQDFYDQPANARGSWLVNSTVEAFLASDWNAEHVENLSKGKTLVVEGFNLPEGWSFNMKTGKRICSNPRKVVVNGTAFTPSLRENRKLNHPRLFF